jgi:NADH-quinone oxidoreductase subunit J
MSLIQILFYFFAVLAIFSSLGVVLSRHPVRAVLFLVLTFVAMAVIWLLLEAEFLALTLILVYVGAVMVLFLFVVMMLDIELPQLKLRFNRGHLLGMLVATTLLSLLVLFVGRQNFGLHVFAMPPWQSAQYNNIQGLGWLLYHDYLLPFEIAGIILLVAMVAAIALAYRGQRSKKQNVHQQVQVQKADRLTVLKMRAHSEDN